MYSVVLMMALSGSADVPAFGKGGCHGGYGGCYGGGGGCYGGGGCHGGKGGLFGKGGGGCHGGGGLFRKGGRGCHGGYGGGCHGGYGGGCCGSYGGGYGGCTGGGYYGGGCTGGAYMGGYSGGCTGGYGGAPMGGCTGGGYYGAPGSMPMAPSTQPEKVKAPKPEKGALTPAPATILVSLPAEAKLTVDGAPTTSTSATRLFVSPALEQGKDYFYTLKADIVREGKPVSVSKRITVHAGQETRVSFEAPATSVASK